MYSMYSELTQYVTPDNLEAQTYLLYAGEFGIVYKGLLRRGFSENFSETVAVKTLKGTWVGLRSYS